MLLRKSVFYIYTLLNQYARPKSGVRILTPRSKFHGLRIIIDKYLTAPLVVFSTCILLIVLHPQTLALASTAKPGSLHLAISRFIDQRFKGSDINPVIHVGRFDPRLSSRPCKPGLQVFLPPGSRLVGRLSVGVHCPGTRPWTIYVPVNVLASGKVLVVAQPLTRGTVLEKHHLAMARRDLVKLPRGFLTDPALAIGRVLRRSVRQGYALNAPILDNPPAIRRGQIVSILVRTSFLEIRMQGLALRDAGLGELVRARNLVSSKVVEGKATESGEILVTL